MDRVVGQILRVDRTELFGQIVRVNRVVGQIVRVDRVVGQIVRVDGTELLVR